MDARTAIELQWPCLLGFLPPHEELEASARELGALRRRRGVDSAATLLRLGLAYSMNDMSLRQTAAWAEAAEVASLSDVALLNRLRNASEWFGHVLARKLAERSRCDGTAPGQWRLRLVDATHVSGPGARGTQWRLHVGWDLGRSVIDSVDLTDEHGAESFLRFQWKVGDVAIADRGYGHRRGLAAVLAAGAHFIVRAPWQNLPLERPDGGPFDLLAALRQLGEAGVADLPVVISGSKDTPPLPARLVAARKSEEAALYARRRILREAGRKRGRIDPRTLEAAGYVFVVTSLDANVSPEEVLELYRMRWQVELAFKRLKSLGHLDDIRARDPRLAHAYILCKLIGAILIDEFSEAYLAFSPWGYRIRPRPRLAMARPAHPS